MTTFVALLRGINVGGHRKVPMSELASVCTSAGFTKVATYIQSGNVVLTGAGSAAAVERKLEKAIHERFGFPVDVIVRTAAAWAGYLTANPIAELAAAAPNRVMLLLSKSAPKVDAVGALRLRAVDGERLEAVGDAIWIHYAAGQAKTKLSPALLDRLVGSPVTARNWRTVLQLAEMTKV